MKVRDLIVSVELEYKDSGRYGLSVSTLANATVDQIVAQQFKRKPLLHPKIRVSTVQAIRQVGFDVVQSGKAPHALALSAAMPTYEQLTTLIGVFGPEQDNPGLATLANQV